MLPRLQRHHLHAKFGIVHPIEASSSNSECFRVRSFKVLHDHTDPGCYRVRLVFPAVDLDTVFQITSSLVNRIYNTIIIEVRRIDRGTLTIHT